MYMKPTQKIKRLLRIKIARDTIQGQSAIKMFGYIHPKKEETSGCKFTSFFRQISVNNEKDKSIVESVRFEIFSGKNQPLPFQKKMESLSGCPITFKMPFPFTWLWSTTLLNSQSIHNFKKLSTWKQELELRSSMPFGCILKTRNFKMWKTKKLSTQMISFDRYSLFYFRHSKPKSWPLQLLTIELGNYFLLLTRSR